MITKEIASTERASIIRYQANARSKPQFAVYVDGEYRKSFGLLSLAMKEATGR